MKDVLFLLGLKKNVLSISELDAKSMRVAEPSCLHHCLQCSGWALSSRLLRYSRLPWLLHLLRHGFRLCSVVGNVLQCCSSILSPLRQNCLSAKLAASSVAAGPCSNSPLTLTCGSPPSHLAQASPAATYPSPPAKSSATSTEVFRIRSALPRHVLSGVSVT